MKKIIFIAFTFIFSQSFVFSQDMITKKNGDDIQAKVLDVGLTEIKYKKFDNPNGPTYSILKSDVLIIRYENGTKDIFNEVQKKNVSNSSNTETIKTDNSNLIENNEIVPLSFNNDIIVFNRGDTVNVVIKKIAKNGVVYKNLDDNTNYSTSFEYISKAYYANGKLIISDGKVINNNSSIMQVNNSNLNNQDKCLCGKIDAENLHGKYGGHFFYGLLFGPTAIICTALAEPTPEKGRFTYKLSRNKDLFNDPVYISCYKKRAKGKLISREALGWATWITFLFL